MNRLQCSAHAWIAKCLLQDNQGSYEETSDLGFRSKPVKITVKALWYLNLHLQLTIKIKSGSQQSFLLCILAAMSTCAASAMMS